MEAVESLQTQLTLVQEGGGEGEKKQIKMLQEVIRNLEVTENLLLPSTERDNKFAPASESSHATLTD